MTNWWEGRGGGPPDLTPTPNAESPNIYAIKMGVGGVLAALGKQASMADPEYEVNCLGQVMSKEVQRPTPPCLSLCGWMLMMDDPPCRSQYL